ncbi:MAG: OmpA family protein [Saprospiraceae bacterium]|nr:OmpA family protein [Saprospiraceae bacterium]
MHKVIPFILVFVLNTNVTGQHSIKKIDYPVNTDFIDEICPVISYDESILFFTRVGDPNCEKTLFIDNVDVSQTLDEHQYLAVLKDVYSQIATQKITDPLSSAYNQDIWYTKLADKKPEGIFHPGFPINDVLPNSICSNYGKDNGFLVINQFAPNGGIERGFSSTEKKGVNFEFPKAIRVKDFNQASTEVNVTASIDSTILILAMYHEDGVSDMDLYVCFKLGIDLYSQPINMGSTLNTQFRESTPMLSHDGKRLYFTSDRPGGYGGKDIYYTDRLDFTFTKWNKPEKLNPPVNSASNDSHPHLLRDNNSLYFTSNRDGSSDIFSAELIRKKLPQDLLLTIYIINGETTQKSAGELFWGDAFTTKRDGYFRSRDGLCRYKFFENKPVAFKASNRSYTSTEIIIDPQDLVNMGLSHDTIELVMHSDGRIATNTVVQNRFDMSHNDKISESELNSVIMLNNIYFERSTPNVLPESYPSILKLSKVLLERPRLYITIIGHTDNVGSKDALKLLSEARSAAIKKILVEQGVPSSRVDTAGFGDTRPLGPNDTETNKSRNRRVEIKIVSQ